LLGYDICRNAEGAGIDAQAAWRCGVNATVPGTRVGKRASATSSQPLCLRSDNTNGKSSPFGEPDNVGFHATLTIDTQTSFARAKIRDHRMVSVDHLRPYASGIAMTTVGGYLASPTMVRATSAVTTTELNAAMEIATRNKI
jgi:hypothetical protein